MQEIQDISNAVFSNSTVGLVIASIIFIIAIIFLVRRFFIAVISIILVIIAIISGFAIYNNDIVKSNLKNSEGKSGDDWESKYSDFKKKLHDKIEDMKKSKTNEPVKKDETK